MTVTDNEIRDDWEWLQQAADGTEPIVVQGVRLHLSKTLVIRDPDHCPLEVTGCTFTRLEPFDGQFMVYYPNPWGIVGQGVGLGGV